MQVAGSKSARTRRHTPRAHARRPTQGGGGIPPSYSLGNCGDPGLAIARARASQDHDAGGPPLQWDILDPVRILVLAKASLSGMLAPEPGSWHILVFSLSVVHQCSSWMISTHHGSSVFIMDQYSSWIISTHHGSSVLIMDHQCSSWIISIHHGSSVLITDQQYS